MVEATTNQPSDNHTLDAVTSGLKQISQDLRDNVFDDNIEQQELQRIVQLGDVDPEEQKYFTEEINDELEKRTQEETSANDKSIGEKLQDLIYQGKETIMNLFSSN